MEIPSYFRRYLKAIQPSSSSRKLAAQLHTTLRERVQASEDLAHWNPDSFLYGSYRRNTAIKVIKDVDVCIVLDTTAQEDTPNSVVNALRKALEKAGYEAKTALQRRSIRIDMSTTTLDAVPVSPLVQDGDALYIPDRKQDAWIPTYPKEHLAVVTSKNKECNGRLVPLIKIVKAWHRFQRGDEVRPKPKGFTLEALVIQHHDPDAPSYAEAFISFLENLDNTSGHLLENGTFPTVPDPGRAGNVLKLSVSESEAKKFGKICRDSLRLAKEAMALEEVQPSAEAWRRVFGNDFPITASSGVIKLAQSELSGSDEDISAEDELEVTEVDLPVNLLPALKIRAALARTQGGTTYAPYPNDGFALRKDLYIRFELLNPPSIPGAEIRWTVENHGAEAREDRGHITFPGEIVRWERTAYRGSHTMICEVLVGERVVSSGRFIVNIQR